MIFRQGKRWWGEVYERTFEENQFRIFLKESFCIFEGKSYCVFLKEIILFILEGKSFRRKVIFVFLKEE